MPDPVRGEEVLACIVPSRSVSADERAHVAAQIVQFGMTKLAYFKVPGYVYFCCALPRTPTEKIQRGELKRVANEALTTSEAVDARQLKGRRSG